jgi:hypothetical protein
MSINPARIIKSTPGVPCTVTLDTAYNDILVDCSAGDVTINMPNGAPGFPIRINRCDSSVNKVLINNVCDDSCSMAPRSILNFFYYNGKWYWNYSSNTIGLTRTYYVNTQGDTKCANGSIGMPFTTITAALNKITNATADTPYQIILGPEKITEATISLKPYVTIVGISESATQIMSTITFDQTWFGNAGYWGTITRCSIVNNQTFNIAAMTRGTLNLNGTQFMGTLTVNGNVGNTLAIHDSIFNGKVVIHSSALDSRGTIYRGDLSLDGQTAATSLIGYCAGNVSLTGCSNITLRSFCIIGGLTASGCKIYSGIESIPAQNNLKDGTTIQYLNAVPPVTSAQVSYNGSTVFAALNSLGNKAAGDIKYSPRNRNAWNPPLQSSNIGNAIDSLITYKYRGGNASPWDPNRGDPGNIVDALSRLADAVSLLCLSAGANIPLP